MRTHVRQVVIVGLKLAFHASEKLTGDHLLSPIPEVRSLSETETERVAAMTAWLERHTKAANDAIVVLSWPPMQHDFLLFGTYNYTDRAAVAQLAEQRFCNRELNRLALSKTRPRKAHFPSHFPSGRYVRSVIQGVALTIAVSRQR